MNISRHSKNCRSLVLKQKGLSLIELVVAVVILALLMAGLAELVVTNSRNATATGKLARMEETGRTAIQILASDVRRAGYYGGNVVVADIGGSVGITTPDQSCVDAAEDFTWATMLAEKVFGVNGAIPAVDFDCIIAGPDKGQLLRGDILTLRYTPSLLPDPDEPLADKRLYLRTTPMDGKVFQGENSADADNLIDDASALVYELAAHSYYVGNTGRQCQSVDIPALYRKSIHPTTGRPFSQELLAGVENMHFRYKVGSRYLLAGAVGLLDTAALWATVEAVEIVVLVRSECPEAGFTNNRVFRFDGIDYDPSDGYRRQLFTSLTQLRN
ncbi:MAG: type IV pilus assembly protein PilW [Halioglobus sp.]|jgi:type IV pilus assembly protein PilW